MPLFEFICIDCNNTFEDLVRSSDVVEEVICPICGSEATKKKISNFSTGGSLRTKYSTSSSGISSGTCISGST